MGLIYEAIPILSSLPRAEATIYLDFDGEIIEGHSWEGGSRIIAPAYNLPASEVTDMWRRVAEDFAPFEVNVTTDLQVYLRAPQGRRIRCITTTNNFASAGGVAFNNTFTESGEPCCWNFYRGNAGAVVISHEVGHTFGLSHDDTTTQGYYGGHGSGTASWGPIMGAPYNQNVCQWSKGDYPNANQKQDDMAIIGASAPRRLDDHSSRFDEATPLTIGTGNAVSNSGVIESRDDVDTFSFTTTGGGAVNLQFNGISSSPNLDIEVKLYNAAGTLLTTVSPANQLSATLSTNLSAGTYYVTVDGTGNLTWTTGGYDDYGSIGGYTITGTVPSPGWRFRVPAYALNTAVVGTVAPGASGYSIVDDNTSGAFVINASTGAITISNATALAANPLFNLTVNLTSSGVNQNVTVPVSVAPLRGLKQEIWTGVTGNGISSLTSLSRYPNSPNLVRYSPTIQASYQANNYGEKLSGYLLPPETGSYTFWTTADDVSDLWLSTDASPNNKVRIAYNTSNTGTESWTQQATQQSAAINLVAGQRYYIESLHREYTGGEHVSVVWQTPSMARALIQTQYLEYPASTLPNQTPWLANSTFRVREDSSIGAIVGTLSAGDFEPGSVLSGYAITGGNTGSAFVLNSTTGVLTVNGSLSFATLPKYYLDVRVADSSGATRTAQIAIEVEARAVKREMWTGVSGNTVASLTSIANYPNTPNSTSYVSFFEPPADVADNYGQKLSGYLRAPDTGSYTFWIASDDASQLWLSTDTNPANKTRIAYTDTATNAREWGRNASQKSATINLEAGRFYYVEVLHKEGVGGDHVSVCWSGPGFDQAILGAPHVTQQFYNHAAPTLANKTVSVFDRDSVVTTLEAKDWADPGTTITYSITGGNADGAYTIDPLTGTISATGNLLPVGNRVLTITASDNGPTPLFTTATVTVTVQKAGLKREVWTGLPSGQALTDLTGWITYPHAPDQVGYTQNFKAPTNAGDYYGQRLSGYVIPPVSGNYTFWIASDDGGELWLSSDTNPANKKRIGYVNNSVNEEQWTAQTNQQSAVIPLVAGQRYYIEALHKEGSGGDHLAVAWQSPTFARVVINSAYLEYPDIIRPALRREVWPSDGFAKWAANPSTGAMEWTSAALAESFENTGSLNGNATESGSANWTASAVWLRNNGVATKSLDGDAVALLPFTPESGKVYTLSMDFDPTNSPGSTDWFSLGFLSQPVTNTGLFVTSSVFPTYGASWVLGRANGNENGNTVRAFSVGTNEPLDSNLPISGAGTYDTLTVVLDTRNADWISRYYLNGNLVGTHNHDGSLLIRSVGFSGFATAKGSVRNFRLATNDDPAVGSGSVGTLLSFKGASDAADDFSERITGFIVPPTTGGYTFWLATDDDGELLLSSDENPANLAKIAAVNGYVDPEAWDVSTSQRSVEIQLVAGQRYYVEVRHRDGLYGDHAAVAWQGPGITRQIIGNSYLEHPDAPSDRTLLRREVWNGVGGNNVTDLTGLSTFPASPSVATTLAAGAGFSTAVDIADNFGQRASGFLVAPETGRFTFWIASDDGGELWLSSNDNPANRMLLANVNGSVGVQDWDAQTNQKSVPVALEAGKRYYIEALHKEGIGGDHLSIAWQGPSFTRQVISNVSLENVFSLPGKPSLKREVWAGVPGDTVANLTSYAPFVTGTPTSRGVLTSFQAPANQGDAFGERISGLLVAPETGSYKFWISSDQSSELWISTDAEPGNRVRIAYAATATGVREWNRFPTQESVVLNLVAGRKYFLEVLHKEGTGDDHLAVAWQGPSFSRQILDGRFLEYPGNPPSTVALKREIWTGISGNNVTDLTNKATYPNSPNQTTTLNEFSTPVNWGDNYGQKVSGYLIAPRTGSYQFWIASDDGSELWLSTNGLPASKTRIAYATSATGQQNWTSQTTQASATISLVAGQRCYIEALHKEGGGDDYLAVAWQGPSFSRQIISSAYLEYPGLAPGETRAGNIVAPPTQNVAYTFWLNALGLTGNDRLPGADPDGDGIANSLEFVLGGKPAGADASSWSLVPQCTIENGTMTFVFRRADVSLSAGPFIEYGYSLDDWSPAVDGIDNVTFSEIDDFYGKGIDKVTVQMPCDGEQKYIRLNSGNP